MFVSVFGLNGALTFLPALALWLVSSTTWSYIFMMSSDSGAVWFTFNCVYPIT